MKHSILLLLAFVMSFSAHAQEVKYNEQNWEGILAAAKEEKKIIFVDCYTDWCGWCKVMDKETMTNPNISAALNGYFIPVKMDMEKGEGIKLAMKYHVTGFPSFLFFDSNGHYIYHAAGYQKFEEFQKLLKGVLSGSNNFSAPGFSATLNENYPDFYVNAFGGNGKRTFPKAEEVSSFLSKQPDMLSEVSWAVFARFGGNEKQTAFFYQNVDDYRKLYGNTTVNNKLNSLIGDKLNDAIKKKDDKAFADVLNMIDKFIKEDPAGAKIYSSIAYYKAVKNWPKLLDAATLFINFKGFDNVDYINSMAWDIYENCTDKNVLNQAAGWMNTIVNKEPGYAYLDTYAALLYKTGKTADAAKYATMAIETGKKEGKDVKSTEELLKKIITKK
jgi:thioredoxin-related protein